MTVLIISSDPSFCAYIIMSEEKRKEIWIHTAKLSRFTSLFDCIPVCYSPARIIYQNCSLLHLAQTLLVKEAPACKSIGKTFGLQISRMLQNWSPSRNKRCSFIKFPHKSVLQFSHFEICRPCPTMYTPGLVCQGHVDHNNITFRDHRVNVFLLFAAQFLLLVCSNWMAIIVQHVLQSKPLVTKGKQLRTSTYRKCEIQYKIQPINCSYSMNKFFFLPRV